MNAEEIRFCSVYTANGGNKAKTGRDMWPRLDDGASFERVGRMLLRQPIQDELARLARCTVAAGLMDNMERRQFLADLTRADVTQLHKLNGKLIQSYEVTETVTPDGDTVRKVRVKIPSKLDALKLDAMLAGELRQDQQASDTDNPLAMEVAAALTGGRDIGLAPAPATDALADLF